MTESRLKTKLLGTREDRERKKEELFNFSGDHPFKFLGKFLTTPGYALIYGIYCETPQITSRDTMVLAGSLMETIKMTAYSIGTSQLATKLGEVYF